MKKTVKIIAFVLLLALAGLCLYKTIYYILDGYYRIYTYFYILIKSGYSNFQDRENVFSYLGIIITCFLNFCYYISIAIYIFKPSLIVKPLKAFINKASNRANEKKQVRKQRKIDKMKSKIKKMESDE